MVAVCRRFGLAPTMPLSAAMADKVLLATEFRDVTTVDDPDWIVTECGEKPLPDYRIDAWSPAVAKARFMKRFEELTA